MDRRRASRIITIASVVGYVAPFVMSVFTMLVTFNTSLYVAKIVAPAILMADRWPDYIIPIANGSLYACLAWALTLTASRRTR